MIFGCKTITSQGQHRQKVDVRVRSGSCSQPLAAPIRCMLSVVHTNWRILHRVPHTQPHTHQHWLTQFEQKAPSQSNVFISFFHSQVEIYKHAESLPWIWLNVRATTTLSLSRRQTFESVYFIIIIIESLSRVLRATKQKYRNNKFDINYITVERGTCDAVSNWRCGVNITMEASTHVKRIKRRDAHKTKWIEIQLAHTRARAHQGFNVCAKNINLMRTKHVSFAFNFHGRKWWKKGIFEYVFAGDARTKRNKKVESKRLVPWSALDFPHSWCGPDDKVKYAKKEKEHFSVVAVKSNGACSTHSERTETKKKWNEKNRTEMMKAKNKKFFGFDLITHYILTSSVLLCVCSSLHTASSQWRVDRFAVLCFWPLGCSSNTADTHLWFYNRRSRQMCFVSIIEKKYVRTQSHRNVC